MSSFIRPEPRASRVRDAPVSLTGYMSCWESLLGEIRSRTSRRPIMAQQVPVEPQAIDGEVEDAGLHEVANDVAYQRLAIVNVVYLGTPDAGDRGWVLIDAGVIGS